MKKTVQKATLRIRSKGNNWQVYRASPQTGRCLKILHTGVNKTECENFIAGWRENEAKSRAKRIVESEGCWICPYCGGWEKWESIECLIGKISSRQCPKCGELYILPDEADQRKARMKRDSVGWQESHVRCPNCNGELLERSGKKATPHIAMNITVPNAGILDETESIKQKDIDCGAS